MGKVMIAVAILFFWISLFWFPTGQHTDIDTLKLYLTKYSNSPFWTTSFEEIVYSSYDGESYDLHFIETRNGSVKCERTENDHEYMPLYACSDQILIYGISPRKAPLQSKVVAMHRESGRKTIIAEENMLLFPLRYNAEENSVVIQKIDAKSSGLGISVTEKSIFLDCER